MRAIEIVKPAIDVGFQTNLWHLHEPFWRDSVGLPYNHLLKVGGGIHQHRFDLHGAVCKVNSVRSGLATDEATGYQGLIISSPTGRTGSYLTPDGTRIEVADPQTLPSGVATIIQVDASDHAATVAALEALGGVVGPNGVAFGESLVDVREVPDRPPTNAMTAAGFRYLTLQVADVRSAFAHALDNGFTEGRTPIRLGDVAFFGMVRLPDGDWIELSQRASLTGPLPDDAPRG